MNSIRVIALGVIKELIRRKDFYLILTLLLAVLLYSASLSFGGESNFYRYFKEIGISLVFIFSVIIAVTFATRQIPQELETKTIYPLLTHPVSRFQFIIGKFLGVLLISVLSFSVFYLIFIISVILKGDFSTPALLLVQGYALHLILLAFFISLSILLSLFLSTAANATISIMLYFATNWFGAVLPAYIFLPHPELFDLRQKIVHTQDVVPAWATAVLITYGAIYTAIFLYSSYLVFRRRNL